MAVVVSAAVEVVADLAAVPAAVVVLEAAAAAAEVVGGAVPALHRVQAVVVEVAVADSLAEEVVVNLRRVVPVQAPVVVEAVGLVAALLLNRPPAAGLVPQALLISQR